MSYKIFKITDLDFKDKTDVESLSRLERTYDIYNPTLFVGWRLLLICISGEKSVLTSTVREITEADDGYIVKTENSYYFIVEEGAMNDYRQMSG